MSQTKTIPISWRDCRIAYDVDMKSVAQLATEYGIEWTDMKKVLRAYGFVIRKNEPRPVEPPKGYTINLVDKDKIQPDPENYLAVAAVGNPNVTTAQPVVA